MQFRYTNEQRNPFLYAGLMLLASAVVVRLFAGNPQVSVQTVIFLEKAVFLLIGGGLCSLLLDPIFRVARRLN